MKRPLLAHYALMLKSIGLMTSLSAVVLTLGSLHTLQAQPIYSQTECQCLNNATTPTNGRYLEFIEIDSDISGQTWRMTNIIGFYNTLSPAPPSAPFLYLNNTIIPETAPGSGVYRMAGYRVSGSSWSVTVTNGELTRTLTSQRNCSYPSTAQTSISGDVYVCQGSTETYSIPASTLLTGVVWSVPNGGTIISTTPNSITVAWGNTPGIYTVGVSGSLSSYATQPAACGFSRTLNVSVTDPTGDTRIRGDFGNCVGATETYRINATALQLSGVSWGIFLDPSATISAGITSSGSINAQTVTWANTGTYYIRVSGMYRPNLLSDACPFNSIQRIDIVNEPIRPLACNNSVNISMNPACELTFTADQFLEDQTYPDNSYDIIIRDIQADTIVPSGTLGYKYINKTLEIKVVHECSGNSCWGYAVIEDKAIPDLFCPNDVVVECSDLDNYTVTGMPLMPVGSTITQVSSDPDVWVLTGYDRCSDVTLTYVDTAVVDLCVGPYSAIIERTWTVTDNTGNTSSCQQTISVLRASIDDVEFPGNFDSVTGPFASIEACSNYEKIPAGSNFAGNPSPNYTGYPQGTLCLKSTVTFTDVNIPICGINSYKIRRRWQVIDHCTGELRTHNQLITVMDTKPPVTTCPPDAIVIANKPHQCAGDWSVLPPTVINDCSSTTWDIEFLLADDNGNPPTVGAYTKKDGNTEVIGSYPNFTIRNLPSGRTWLRYTTTDACGNFSYCFTEVDVEDKEQPTPVCDLNTIVSLGPDGTAKAGVYTFDDGSHDNCALECIKVRRMDQNISWNSIPCDNQINFTCSDLNKVIIVELGVWDKAGFFNSCMVETRIQDNYYPVLTPPSNRNVNCGEDLTSLTRFGTATVTDNCSATIAETRLDQLNECGIGTITRTFTATDTYGNKTSATQVLTISPTVRFNASGNDINWPDDITLNNACVTNIDPENLPAINAYPVPIRNTNCTNLAYSHEDIVFNFVDGVCYKVLRKWTVIDWCQNVPGFPGIGVWEKTQLIMINNVTAPDITFGCQASDLTINQVGACQANVSVTARANDDCTPDDQLEWQYMIDIDNNGTTDIVRSGKSINQTFNYGTHKITWIVTDKCGNEKRCPNTFTLSDTKKPTPYCISDVVTVIMPTTKSITIWASDFDLGATDNCSSSNQIRQAFSTNPSDISRTFTCEDLNGQDTMRFSLNVYAIDAANNSDFCTVNLIVQSNNNSCDDNADDDDQESKISLKGAIYTEESVMVENVNVMLESDLPEFPIINTTSDNGAFEFKDLGMYANYSLSPENNNDPLNGVTTMDLVMIQRHILDIEHLDSPYKLIAADVNNSGRVSAADLVDLRKLILGIIPNFSNNKSWRFVDVAQVFTDVNNPFPFVEKIQMSNLDHNVAGLDFVGVKTGDVNGTAQANTIKGNGTQARSIKRLMTESITASEGEIVDVKVNVESLSQVLGMQMSIQLDVEAVEFVSITGKAIDLKDDHIGWQYLDQGIINLSWSTENPLSIDQELFTVRLKMTSNVKDRSVVLINSSMILPEIYTLENNHLKNHRLRLDNTTGLDGAEFEVYQNIPNPFNNSTNIGFSIPKEGTVTLNVYNIAGQLIHTQSSLYPQGFSTIHLEADKLSEHGVYFYQVESQGYTSTRKMLFVK